MDWFCNTMSNNDLRNMLNDLHEEVFGSPLWLADAGRCTLASRLEELFDFSDIMKVPA